MNELDESYRRRFDVLTRLSRGIEEQLREYFAAEQHIDRITARQKSIDRFLAKAVEKGQPKYTEPLHQIRDQVGARVITFYLSDVVRAAAIIERYSRQIEARDVIPESQWEFGSPPDTPEIERPPPVSRRRPSSCRGRA